MITLRTNISQIVRQIDYLGQAIFKDVGDALAQGVWEEFVVLLNETAQWSGSAAASWNLSMGGDSSVRLQPKRTKKEALAKGHQAAVKIAEAHNYKALLDISTQYKQKALMVENHAPSADRAETGPLRAVNSPTGALARFEQRVANRAFMIRDRVL